MAQLFANGARAELSAPITNAATSLTVTSGGNVFPDTTGGHFFYAVLQDDAGYEIIRVSSHLNGTSPDSMSSILRGQFGTSARAVAAGAIIGQRVVAARVLAQPVHDERGGAPLIGGQRPVAHGEVLAVAGDEGAQRGFGQIRHGVMPAGWPSPARRRR